eukprot:7016035-Pyramimonas_sp.AAC.1
MLDLERDWQNIQELYWVLGDTSGPECSEARERVCSSVLHVPAAYTPAHRISRTAYIRAVQ